MRRDFHVFWLGQALSFLGDSFALIATPLLVLQATGSVATMGMLSAAAALANLLSGLLAGAIVDRTVDRRRLMIRCDILRAVVWAAVPIAWSLHGPRLALLFAASTLSSAVGNLFHVAAITAVPTLVSREHVGEANGRIEATFSLMLLVGPTAAGLLCKRFGAEFALGIDALSFVVSAISIASIRLDRTSPVAPGSPRVWRDLAEGVSFVWREPRLRAITLLFAASNMLIASRTDLVIYYVKHALSGTDSDVGTVFSVSSLGSLVAGLLVARMRRWWGFGTCWLAATALLGIGVAACGFAGSIGGLACCGALCASSDTVRGVNSMTLRQEITPEPLLGRVTAAFWLLIGVTAPLGNALGAAFAARQGATSALLVGGIGTALSAGVGLFSSIREPSIALPAPAAANAAVRD